MFVERHPVLNAERANILVSWKRHVQRRQMRPIMLLQPWDMESGALPLGRVGCDRDGLVTRSRFCTGILVTCPPPTIRFLTERRLWIDLFGARDRNGRHVDG